MLLLNKNLVRLKNKKTWALIRGLLLLYVGFYFYMWAFTFTFTAFTIY